MKKGLFTTHQMTDVAILLGIAFVLQLITFLFVVFNIGIGGSISISMIPLFIIIYRHGFPIGALAGVLYGLFEMALYSVMVAALAESLGVYLAIIALDYVVAFGILSVSSFIFKLRPHHVGVFAAGIVVGGLLRYATHVVSGVLLFRDWLAFEYPDLPYLLGSMALNALYMGPSIVATVVLGSLVFIRIKPMLQKEA